MNGNAGNPEEATRMAQGHMTRDECLRGQVAGSGVEEVRGNLKAACSYGKLVEKDSKFKVLSVVACCLTRGKGP